MPASHHLRRSCRALPHLLLIAAVLLPSVQGAPLTKPPGTGITPPFPPPPPPKESTTRPPKETTAPPPRETTPSKAAASMFAFKATTLDGEMFDFDAVNATRKIVVYLFDPAAPDLEASISAAERLHAQRAEYQLAVVGVAMPPGARMTPGGLTAGKVSSQSEMAATVKERLAKADATFPCVSDATGSLTERFLRPLASHRLVSLTTFFTFPLQAQGADGQAVFAAVARESADPVGIIYRGVLKALGVEALDDLKPLVAGNPQAPDAAFTDVAGKTRRISDYRGQLLVLVFFIRECPLCKGQLAFLEETLKSYGQAAGREKPWLEVAAISTDTAGGALKDLVAERGYSFPVATDPDWGVRRAFRVLGPVPDTYLIAPDGTIRYHHRSSQPGLNDVLLMEIRTLLGVETKPLLAGAQFSGDRSCRVCHAKQHIDWELTRHACAWETLVRLGKQTDPECVRCHVVGASEVGGFVNMQVTPHLANVQCESCHGGNGCAAFTGKKPDLLAAAVCQKCHDAKHSPRFDFIAARPRTLHNRAEELAKLAPAEREAQMRKLCSGEGRQLFPPDTPYIGSAACAKCHPTEAKAEATGPHSRGIQLLATPAPKTAKVPPEARGVEGLRKPECLRCHTTGFNRPNGFPAAAPGEPAQHAMAGVGCEACHGPGKTHADDPKETGAIARLGGTCNECNILPICRQCHDDANSPTFDYKTALPKTRHSVGKAVKP